MSTQSPTASLSRTAREVASRLVIDLNRASELEAGNQLNAAVAQAMARALAGLAATGVWGPENRLPSSEFWRVAGEILSQGSLQLHARQKPFGYAGDHEMLFRICRQDRRGDRLGRAFDDYFQRQAAPHAVRNRARLIADEMVATVRRHADRCVKTVVVGSGPAEDVWLAQQTLEPDECQRLEVHLLDLDPRALEFCERRLTTSHDAPLGTLICHRKNLKRLNRDAAARDIFGLADLIVCPGFLDYLNHKEVAGMLALFFGHLRKDGKLYAFNFAQHNPSRAYMEWLGNWYLVYRSVEDLRRARCEAGIPESCETVGCEEKNVNLFVSALKA